MTKNSDLGVRTASAIVMLAVAGGALWAGGLWLNAFIVVVSLAAFAEFVALVFRVTTKTTNRALAIASGAIYLGLATFALIMSGSAGVVHIVGVVIMVDTFAYFFGRFIGGPKIAPKISPSKTWAGLLGGAIGASLFLFAMAQIPLWLCEISMSETDATQFGFDGGCSQFLRPDFSYFASSLLLGLLIAIVAQAGDFLESWLKRKAGVKDSSNLIPGHGGVFDRVDGLIAVAFIVGILLLPKL